MAAFTRPLDMAKEQAIQPEFHSLLIPALKESLE